MGSKYGIAAAFLLLGAIAPGASAQNYLGLPALPNGADWAAYTAGPCLAPAYGTYSSVLPGTYDCPNCCQNIWGGYCQKKALRYARAVANNCPACTGEDPCPASRCAPAAGCRSCESGCVRLPEQSCTGTPLPPAPEPAAPLLPIPAKR